MKIIIFILVLLLPSPVFPQTHDTINVAPTGGDYTTLAAAISGEAQDLTSTNKVLHFRISGDWSGGYEEGQVHVTGYTTDATRYINIFTDGLSRHSGIPWAADSFYRIWNTTTDNNGNLRISEPYTRVNGIIVAQGGGGDPEGDFLVWLSSCTGTQLSHMIVIDSAESGTTTGIRCTGDLTGLGITNSMFHEMNNQGAAANDSGQAIFFLSGSADSGAIANNTFNDNDCAIRFGPSFSDSSTLSIINNILKSSDSVAIHMKGVGADTGSFKKDTVYIFANSWNSSDGVYYIGPSADTAGAALVVTTDWALVDPNNDDLHLEDEGNTETAIDLGVDLRAAGSKRKVTVTVDVDNMVRRGVFDIGFDEVLHQRKIKIVK